MMRLFIHIVLILCVLTARPLEGNSQSLPAKIHKSLKSVSQVSSSTIRRIPVGGHITPPPIGSLRNVPSQTQNPPRVDLPIIQSAPKLPLPIIMVDTTIFERMKQRNRMNEIVEKSRERVERSFDELFSLLSKKDRSFAYLEYKYEESRLHMLIKISLNPESFENPANALKIMEKIYKRKVLVLPSLSIDIPQCAH